ncbi:hypothetical protein [Paracoccus denitrificans]|jgi:methylenetetrahydrofolate reductase (NADPH)|uniref:hypothetical protein n=1 Tax=Paracoccus denitrificans TaxID=266 RepID=UPI000B26CB34|nr:hypothetical protein [Paracoccus denitrificans]MBB4626705.1 5,10-methylenetetrahydrofolate reductase [Paracoccus denitrificans]MCU7427809.1 hypothetical protein [Paracoccus denitrificans]QAR25062.1 hypothetical protein EO213_01240 [Paracoccus denitrificans]UPV93756.1 hypothetical protein M0K93_07610 [Paracoccus denitrificans]WQO34035.1 hypothetical protein U0005_02935 [Paracoccus denitrificans]
MESALQQNRMTHAKKLLASTSFEVTPRSWKLFLSRSAEGAGHILPGTKVFIAHIEGVPIKEMVETARMLRLAGADPVPHIPARLVPDKGALQDWLSAYRGEAGVTQALVIAGLVKMPAGDFSSSMDLVATGLFDRNGFTDLAFAGHPEGCRDVDPDGGSTQAGAALRWKQAFRDRTGLGGIADHAVRFRQRPRARLGRPVSPVRN